MQELDDNSLLKQYAEQDSEEAFAAIVSRHINKVYSVALRHTGNPAEAEEIAQAVFVVLARKANSLSKRVVLSGWLYQTARLTSLMFLRREIRRARREQEAYMESVLNEPVNEAWTEIAPLLDAAMASLNETDRHAVVLRFLDGKSLREVGAVLGATDDATKMRVSRALEKLRRFLARRGVNSTTAIIAGAISSNSVQAAPPALAQSVTAAALAKGAAASTSTLTLVKGALKVMAWTKVKTAVVIGVVVLLAAGTTAVTIHQLRKPAFNRDEFWATTYPSGRRQMFANAIGPIHTTFPPLPVQLCSISGLLNQCMQVSGSCYLIEKGVSAGTVKFGHAKPLNGDEWLAAFENALQTNTPEWWDFKMKQFHRENLVLIRYPDQKIVLVLPPEKAAQYQNLAPETVKALAKEFEPAVPQASVIEPAAPQASVISPEGAFRQECTNDLNLAKQWGLCCRIFAQDHTNRLPEKMAELKAYAGNLPYSNWEMVSGGSLDTIRNPSATIMLREKEPRQGPDGTFVKAYTFADGRARLETSPDRDFSTLERERGFLVHPAGN